MTDKNHTRNSINFFPLKVEGKKNEDKTLIQFEKKRYVCYNLESSISLRYPAREGVSWSLTRNPICMKDDKLAASGKLDNQPFSSELHTASKLQLVYRNLKTDSYVVQASLCATRERRNSISNEKAEI